ncbi:CHAT domain-containing protein [Aquimarina celericrescens]|uniref:Tetratricopeptide repeat protein n=1 Tax=Aquimarina celericrescens TaxID=1964542 RepID=A0ABW5AXA9_9FLAO|nr:CHAT domain-containing protein [Aquimarina celericrescens]
MRFAPSIFVIVCITIPFFNAQAQTAKDTLLAWQYYQKADSLLTARKHDSSIKLFSKALPVYKKAKAWERVASCYNKISENQWRNRKLKESLFNAKKAMEINSKYIGQNTAEEANAYYNLGNYHDQAFNFDNALNNYKKSLEIRLKLYSENHLIFTTLYNSIGIIYAKKRDPNKALEYFQKALFITMEVLGKYHPKVANFHNNIGLIYSDIGKYDLAIENYKQSIEIKINKFGKEHKSVISSYVNIGNAYLNRLEVNKALGYYEEALRLSIVNENQLYASKSYENIGTLYNETYAFDKALEYYKKALDNYQRLFGDTHPSIAELYNKIGITYKNKENYVKALEYLKRGIEINEKLFHEDHPILIKNYHNAGIVYHKMKLYDEALEYYQKGLNIILNTYGEKSSFAAHSYNNFGKTYEEIEDYATALEYFIKSQNTYKNSLGKNNPKLSTTYNYTAFAYSKSGEFYNALQHYQKALIVNSKQKEKNTANNSFDPNEFFSLKELLISLEGKAKIFKDLYDEKKDKNNLEESIVIYNNADLVINSIRQSLNNYRDKVTFVENSKKIYQGTIEAHIFLHQLENNSTSLDKAFYYAEKSKANVLKEQLNTFSAKSFAQLPKEIISLEQNLKTDKAFYQSQLLSEVSKKRNKDSLKIKQYENQLFDLSRKQDSLTNVLEKEYPKYYQLKYQNDVVSVSDIQDNLDNTTTLVEFFTTDSITYAFTITKNKLAVKPLSTPNLQQDIEQFRKDISNKDLSSFKNQSNQLYQKLISPIKNELVGDQLIIVPDGPLWHLNFDLLLTRQTDTKNPKDLPYLLRHYTVSYANSATLLFNSFQNQKRSGVARECLAFSFSDSTNIAETKMMSLATLRDAGDDLPGTRKEIKAISDIIDGQYYYGSQAIEANFKNNADKYNILHLALHGEVDHEHPENSRLFFTKSKDTLEDSFLYTHELFALNIPAELTVLSACNTGSGKIAKGEGIMSLGNAFQYAGAKSLLLTGWEVSDQTTPDLMKYFYSNLKEGMNKAKALQQAKLQYLSTANINRTHPFYWGGFYLVGDPAPIHFDNPTWQYWTIGLGLLGLLFLILFWYRKKA